MINRGVNGVISSIGDIYYEQGNYQIALEKFKEVGDRVKLGKTYVKIGEYVEALNTFNFVLSNELRKKLKNFYVLSEGYLGLGKSFEGLGQCFEAAASYLELTKLVEAARSKIVSQKQRQSYFAISLSAYENLVNVLNEINNQDKKYPTIFSNYGECYSEMAFNISEKAKARLLVEMVSNMRSKEMASLLPKDMREKEEVLRFYLDNLEGQIDQAYEKGKEGQQVLARNINEAHTELEQIIAQIKKDYPDYAALRYPEAVTVAKLPLQDNERLLEYQVTEDASYLFVVQKGKVDKFLKISISQKELEENPPISSGI